MQVVRVSKMIVWAAEPRTTNPRCQGEAGVDLLDLGWEEEPRQRQIRQQKVLRKRYPSGSYRACSSGKPWGLLIPVQGVEVLRILTQAWRRVLTQMIEYSVNSVVASLLRRLLRGIYLIVSRNTRLI